MSFIFVAIAAALTFALGTFAADLADAATLRARAQIAADAAALAAVAESTPYGGGAPEAAARSYAARNGAALISCSCDPGGLEASVAVEIDGVRARSRAIFDPEALLPAVPASVDGLHPDLARAVRRLISAAHGAVRVVSGYRSPEEQAALWADALRRYGSAEAADDWVAPPGRSMHNQGLAVDLGGDLDLAARLVRELGLPLHRPLPNEPWHFELVGSRAGDR
ncbi:MAG: D-alanyl-D-alanine carboxypeptidase family protein [Actinomycetota bacterium]